MRYTLLPCPHCGGTAYLERAHRAFVNARTTPVAFVRCTECNARSGRYRLEDYGTANHSSDAERLAVESWNRRDG